MKKAIAFFLILTVLLTVPGCAFLAKPTAPAEQNTPDAQQNETPEQQDETPAEQNETPAQQNETPEEDAAVIDDEIVSFDDDADNGPVGYTVKKGDFIWLHNPDGSIWLDQYVGSAETVTIPATEENIPVTGIDVWAFRDNTALKHLTIPDTVTTIEENAFMGCSSLVDVKMPPRLVKLGDQVFMKCAALKKITVPDGVPGLFYMEFAFCTGLEEIVLPASITAIKEQAFRECAALKKVYFKGERAAWDAIEITENADPAHYGAVFEVICNYAG